MKTILQLSDFHIKSTMVAPEENVVINSLIDFLKSQNITNPILVYNGDVIDSKCIGNEISSTASNSIKSEEWTTKARQAFALAEKYFLYIMKKMDISEDRIVICCGNHDINRYTDNKTVSICDYKKVIIDEKRFELISNFIKKITGRNNTYETHFRKIDGINFIIANSNWSDKASQNLCINCTSLEEILSKNFSNLQTNLDNFGKSYNVFISHAPLADFCENSKYSYVENNRKPIMDKISNFCGLQLYGDKHTNNKYNQEYIVGAPIDSDFITCGLHQYNDNNQHIYRSLQYKNGIWQYSVLAKDLEELLKASENSLKKKALYYLFGSSNLEYLSENMQIFEYIKDKSRQWKQLDNLFRSYVSLQKTQNKKSGHPLRIKDSLINTITEIIINSNNKTSITLRGNPRTGKSIFLSIVYLNLLYEFFRGYFKYIPIYINIEEIKKSAPKINADTKRYKNTIVQEVKKILNLSIRLAEKYSCRPCYIIDGITQHVFYSNANIEQELKTLLETTKYSKTAHYLYCIDTDNDLHFKYTPQHSDKNSEYVVYFNTICTHNVNSSDKYETFVRAFCELNNHSEEDSISRVLSNIDKLELQEIDLNTLEVFQEQIFNGNDCSFFDILDDFVEYKLSGIDISLAAESSYLLYMENKNFSEVRQSLRNRITFDLLETIRTQKFISKYLLAVYYVSSIESALTKDTLINNSIFNQLFEHNICVYIRGYIQKKNLKQTIISFAEKFYKELSFFGKSTLTYIIGRLSYNSTILMDILNEEEKQLLSETHEYETYDYFIAKRSITLSKIICSDNPQLLLNNYIELLFGDSFERKVNRDFYMLYYGDRKHSELKIKEDRLFEGFDIYNTYHILASRLKSHLDSHQGYPLLELDLFTLCDLIQIRYRICSAQTKSGNDTVNSFFYNDKYKTIALNILSSLTGIIEDHSDNLIDNPLLSQYLSIQKKNFSRIKDKLSNESLSVEDCKSNFDTPLKLLRQINQVKRIGWNIDEHINILTDQEYSDLVANTDCHENVLEHIFESFLIALLYLPPTSYDNQEYNKQKVLNTLLIHDLGESYIGDYPPMYESYNKKKDDENEFCVNLFFSGVQYITSDLTEFLLLWNEWQKSDTSNYNVQIAKEIDKIQMLYKLFTLMSENELHLTNERIQDFYEVSKSIKSPNGKRIFNLLIADNLFFTGIAKKHNIGLKRLK